MSLPAEILDAGLPPLLIEHLKACVAAGLDGRALAHIKAEPRQAADAMKRLFATASRLTSLSPDEVLLRTDLGVGDLRGHRVDGALAELRSICFLGALGFTRITPLAADDKRPRADLTAEKDGERWAVDARCASRTLLPEASFRRGSDGSPLPFPTLYAYLVHVRDEKAEQLERTRKDEGCTRSAVAIALDGDAPGALMRSEALKAWLACGSPGEFRFGLMAGLLSAGSSDDCLVPAP